MLYKLLNHTFIIVKCRNIQCQMKITLFEHDNNSHGIGTSNELLHSNLKLEDVEGTNIPNKQHSSNKQQQHSAAKLHDKLDKTKQMVRFSN